MSPRFGILPCLALAVCTAAGSRAAQLPAWSPFTSPQAAVDAPARPQMLEFRGVLTSPAGTEFVVLDKARKASAWLKLNQRNSDFDLVVKKYDRQSETLTVEQSGGVQELPLRKGKIVAALGAAPVVRPPIPVPPPAPPPSVSGAPVAGAPATPAQTMQQVAADVLARRAAREQAAANSSVQPR